MSVRNNVGHAETSFDSPPFDSLNAAHVSFTPSAWGVWGAVVRHHLSTASKADARGALGSESLLRTSNLSLLVPPHFHYLLYLYLLPCAYLSYLTLRNLVGRIY